jgi:alkanesulfonate monooxygenase SsuD/methylene tetrahydromethanopterin reductase-like flavin-dependent oxidoreductase (luciferase family)
MLQLAGELADTAVIGALWSEDGLRFAVEQVRLGAQRGDRNPDDLGIMSWITCYVTEEKERWLDFFRPSAAHILAGAPAPVFSALRLTNSFMTELKSAYAQGGAKVAARLIPDQVAHQLGAIGRSGEVAEQIQRAKEANINQLGILVNAPKIDHSVRFLRRFSEEVLPRLG